MTAPTTVSRLHAARENAFEASARARKVEALCRVIPIGDTREANLRTASFFEQVSVAQWETLARHVGVNPPSPVTIGEVCKALRARAEYVARVDSMQGREEARERIDASLRARAEGR